MGFIESEAASNADSSAGRLSRVSESEFTEFAEIEEFDSGSDSVEESTSCWARIASSSMSAPENPRVLVNKVEISACCALALALALALSLSLVELALGFALVAASVSSCVLALLSMSATARSSLDPPAYSFSCSSNC